MNTTDRAKRGKQNFPKHSTQSPDKRLSEVVPAKAGIQSFLVPRLRGDDRRLSIVWFFVRFVFCVLSSVLRTAYALFTLGFPMAPPSRA